MTLWSLYICLRIKKKDTSHAPMANLPPTMLEQISMYMVALPCPPLPIMLAKFSADEKPQEMIGICTSHDLLAGLLLTAMVRGNKELNEKRKQTQLAITKTLIDKCARSSNASEMYEYCQEFTAEYVHAFDDAGTCTPAVCFMRTDEVAKNDKVHKGTCSWHAAQDIIQFPPEKRRKAEVFAEYSYAELIEEHWKRFQADEEKQTQP